MEFEPNEGANGACARPASDQQHLEEDEFPEAPQGYLRQDYTRMYWMDAGGEEGNDLAMYAHPTGIAVVALAQGHAALAALEDLRPASRSKPASESEGPPVSAAATLSFDVGGGRSLLQAEMRKGRGPWLAPGQTLCTLRCGGRSFPVACPARAVLVEGNAALEARTGAELLR